MFPASFPVKFLTFLVAFYLHSTAAMSTPISCANCTICQSVCRPPPASTSPTYEVLPPPPPPMADPEPLPVPVAPSNCPPAVVQCCQFLPAPPPPNGNIYTPFYNESSTSFLKLGLVSVMAPLVGLAAIF